MGSPEAQTPSSADMTRSLLQIGSFISLETEQLTRASAAQLGTEAQAADQLSAMNVGVLRLVVAERRREREAAWQTAASAADNGADAAPDRSGWRQDWNDNWALTEERRQRLMRRYPLQIRAAGRTVMNIVNGHRLDDRGKPYGTRHGRPPGETVEMVPFGTITAARTEEPWRIARQLKLAGAYRRAHARPDTNYSQREYPRDALAYLDIYPPPAPFGKGEADRRRMRKLFDISDNLLNRIIADHDIFPVVRIFEGRGAHEVEAFTAQDVGRISQAVGEIPLIGADEIMVSDVLRHLGSDVLGRKALRISGVEIMLRRKSGPGRGHAVMRQAADRVVDTYNHMTVLEAGEAGMEELAELTGLSITTIRTVVMPADLEAARRLHLTNTGVPRAVFPPENVEGILARIASRYGREVNGLETIKQYRAPRQIPSRLWQVPETGIVAGAIVDRAQTRPRRAPGRPPKDRQAAPRSNAAAATNTPARPPETSAPAVAAGAETISLPETQPAIPAAPELPAAAAAPDTPPAAAPIETPAPQEPAQYMPAEEKHAELPEEPPEPVWYTAAEIAKLTRSELALLAGQIRMGPPKPGESEKRNTSGGYKDHYSPQYAAGIAQAIFSRRRSKMPSLQLNVAQIALMTGRHPEEVHQRIRAAKIIGITNTNGSHTYSKEQLDQALALFNVAI
jgi:hypothetical protein